MSGPQPVEVMIATGDSWPDLEHLFGTAGASNGCWCQYWLLGADYHRRERSENRHDLQRQARSGRAGLLAYSDGQPVGWARFTPRSDLRWLLDRFSAYDFGSADAWSLSCFFVTRHARGTGVMSRLIEFAIDRGRADSTVIEGYPIDTAVGGATRNVFPGTLQPFLRAGFVEQGRLAKDRVVVTSAP